jgi:hypothetical protein
VLGNYLGEQTGRRKEPERMIEQIKKGRWEPRYELKFLGGLQGREWIMGRAKDTLAYQQAGYSRKINQELPPVDE